MLPVSLGTAGRLNAVKITKFGEQGACRPLAPQHGNRRVIVSSRDGLKTGSGVRQQDRSSTVAKAAAAAAPPMPSTHQQPVTKNPWWTRDSAENMVDVNSAKELVEALKNAGDRLVIVDFYAQWCNSCRALYPKLCKLCREHEDILFIKVNWENNKGLCKALGIKVLPYFQFYRGAEGRLDAFSASISKFQRLKDALEKHNTPRCSLGPPPPLQNVFAEKKEEKKPAKSPTSLLKDSVKWNEPHLSPAV